MRDSVHAVIAARGRSDYSRDIVDLMQKLLEATRENQRVLRGIRIAAFQISGTLDEMIDAEADAIDKHMASASRQLNRPYVDTPLTFRDQAKRAVMRWLSGKQENLLSEIASSNLPRSE